MEKFPLKPKEPSYAKIDSLLAFQEVIKKKSGTVVKVLSKLMLKVCCYCCFLINSETFGGRGAGQALVLCKRRATGKLGEWSNFAMQMGTPLSPTAKNTVLSHQFY